MNKQFLKRTTGLILLCLTLASAPCLFATTVVFSDNFDDGDISDWTKSTNYGSTSVIEASSNFVVSGLSLNAFLLAPPGGNNLVVRANHDFFAPVTGTYTIDMDASSAVCGGCTISYDVLVDNVLQVRRHITTFEDRSFNIALTEGVHTLSLGMHTTNASSGQFNAFFDNVVILTEENVPSAVPEPSSFLLLLITVGLGANFFSSKK